MTSSRTIVVTGAAGDIGMAIASRYAARGDLVVLCDVKGEALRARVERQKFRRRLEAHEVDLRDPAQVERFAHDVLDRHRKVDVLVNNAAFQHDGDVVATSTADFEDSFAINLPAPFLVAKAVTRPCGRMAAARSSTSRQCTRWRQGPPGSPTRR